MVIDGSTDDLRRHRRSLWDYYDRRVSRRLPGLANAHAYWTGLGVEVSVDDIASEASQLERSLRELSPVSFVDVGAGPGTFTHLLPGNGLAVDQSHKALKVLRTVATCVPVVQGDAMRLPLPDQCVERIFASHLYGLLLPNERAEFFAEAHRVADQIVILDAGRPSGVPPEHWQDRTLSDGGRFKVFRRHFEARELASEIGGVILFDGRFYVMVEVR